MEPGALAESTIFGAGIFPAEGMLTAFIPLKAEVLSEAQKTVIIEQCLAAGLLQSAGWLSNAGTFTMSRPRGTGYRPVFAAPGVSLPAGNGVVGLADGVTAATGTRTRATASRRRVTAKTGT